MLKVTFAESGQKLALWLEGHAGYAEQGKDIVCASASILAYTLASIVESFPIDYAISLDEGDSVIECECRDRETFISVKNAYNYTKVGYALLQQSYPQYVSLLDLT
jgi:uncharacterized protein YsxB (DUF464 family)